MSQNNLIALWNLYNGDLSGKSKPTKPNLRFKGMLIHMAKEGRNFFDYELNDLKEDLEDNSIVFIGCFPTGRWNFLFESTKYGCVFQDYEIFYCLGVNVTHEKLQSFLDNPQDNPNVKIIRPYDDLIKKRNELLKENERLRAEINYLKSLI